MISLSFSVLSAQDAEPVELTWGKISGTKGYALQVRDSSGTLLENITLTKNSYSFKFPEGNYSIRIASLNRFNKPSVWSEWKNLYRIKNRLYNQAEKTRMDRELAEKNLAEENEKKRLLALKKENSFFRRWLFPKKKDPQTDKKTQQKTEAAKFTGITPEEALWRSAVIPGWGQYKRGDVYLGATMLALFSLSLNSSFHAEQKYLHANQYLSDLRSIIVIPSIIGAFTYWQQIDPAFVYTNLIKWQMIQDQRNQVNKLKIKSKQRVYAGSLLYLIILADAYFSTKRESLIKEKPKDEKGISFFFSSYEESLSSQESQNRFKMGMEYRF